MATEPAGDLVVSVQPFMFGEGAGQKMVSEGAVLRAGSPIVKRHGGFFVPLVIVVENEPDFPPTNLQVVVVGENGAVHGWKMAGLKRRRGPAEREVFL